ncbi:MAG: DUF2513 domain-containing protein [Porticoccaceae bacterium]
MERNWDTIRELLTLVEESCGHGRSLQTSDFPAERIWEISHHIELLLDAGLISANMFKPLAGPPSFSVSRLTWDGHEFLDAIRSDTVWQRTKNSFVSSGISMTFDLVKSVALDVAAAIVKSHLVG